VIAVLVSYFVAVTFIPRLSCFWYRNGLLPVALEHAVGLERLSPLADTAIGGLLVGTVLSLFYPPMFYVWVKGRGK